MQVNFNDIAVQPSVHKFTHLSLDSRRTWHPLLDSIAELVPGADSPPFRSVAASAPCQSLWHFESPELATWLAAVLNHGADASWSTHEYVVSTGFRAYQNAPGWTVRSHMDRSREVRPGLESTHSCLLYLNTVGGGVTWFTRPPTWRLPWSISDTIECAPSRGDILLFPHYVLHGASPVEGSTPKRTVRADVAVISRP
jgi:hypothetical protein